MTIPSTPILPSNPGLPGAVGQLSAKVPSPLEIRAEFEDLVIRDLHGPAGGENERLPGRERVADRYLVGVLAPKGTVAHDPERDDPVTVETGQDSNGGRATDTGAAVAVLYPSSLGLTCTVADSVNTLKVTGQWGWYRKEKEENAAEGQPTTAWQRYPIEAAITLPLAEGPISARPLSSGQPSVVVRGEVRRLGSCLIVTLFLVNQQAIPQTNRDEAWLFQASLSVEAPDGEPVFIGRAEAVPSAELGVEDRDAEQLDMLYRNLVEFATGHGTAVHAAAATDDPTRAVRLTTTAVPSYEVPRTEAPTAADIPALAEVVLDMKALSEQPVADIPAMLTPLVDAYEAWIDAQEARIGDPAARLAKHKDAAHEAIATARKTAERIRAGIAMIADDPDAAAAFQFANRAMWHQRVRIVATDRRRDDPATPFADHLAAADIPANRSWRPFQLAFVLLNLPSLTSPDHAERGHPGLVDLLFFPTGGGKTEAYLGLTAFTFAIRRVKSATVDGYDGDNGVAVLMRYTLRLLTADQFKRAAALVCACEMIRREEHAAGNTRFGDTPFRIGLWVGMSVAPNRTAAAAQAINAANGHGGPHGGGSSPVQLAACPWCGLELKMGRDAETDPVRWRTLLFCSDPHGDCDFTRKKSPGEGLPMVTVDEEIYRLLPALLIATADKFAQLPWQGPVGMLFGQVSGRCERHGFRCPDLDQYSGHEEADTHPAKNGYPKAKTVPWGPIRPPDLIIQDELHLIAGPLGSMAGLYETAIDRLASWTYKGKTVRPKVIASTATVRRAREQAYALFWRELAVFPPPVLDIGDSFFALQRPVSEASPGRRYRGICAPGVRMKAVDIRVFTTVLAAGLRVFQKYGALADPYMTLVGYFNALRELGGTRRLIEDEVRSRLWKQGRRGLADRLLYSVHELTSRVSSDQIPEVLALLRRKYEVYPPAKDTPKPVDVVLATNMISVGVDVGRLGLMVAVGQPKATAEYIQATSRVGREVRAPGIIFTIYNWARPRDLSHYERFEHYHATFYGQVEALSVTPFAPRALDRGLTALLVALVRQHGRTWNANPKAHDVPTLSAELDALVQDVAHRAGDVTASPAVADEVSKALRRRLDLWHEEQKVQGRTLGYRGDGNATYGLLQTAGNGRWDVWTAPNSLRDTEPLINLIMTEGKETGMPAFHFGPTLKGGTAGAGSRDAADAVPVVTTAEDLTPQEAAEIVAAAAKEAH